MNSTNDLKVGDLVKILDIDVRDDWDVDGTPQGSSIPSCPIGRIGRVMSLNPENETYVYAGRYYKYSVDCGIGRFYIFDRRDLELVFDTGF